MEDTFNPFSDWNGLEGRSNPENTTDEPQIIEAEAGKVYDLDGEHGEVVSLIRHEGDLHAKFEDGSHIILQDFFSEGWQQGEETPPAIILNGETLHPVDFEAEPSTDFPEDTGPYLDAPSDFGDTQLPSTLENRDDPNLGSSPQNNLFVSLTSSITLDLDDKLFGFDSFSTYVENSPPVDLSPGADIAGPTSLSGALIQLLNPEEGDRLFLESSMPEGLNATINEDGTEIQITGRGSVSSYENALEMVDFVNPLDDFEGGTREVSFQVWDGDNVSNTAIGYIEVVPVNDPPELGVDDAVNTNLNAAFIENGGEIPIADVSAIADLDDTNIESATITLTNPFAGDALSLAGSLPAGIVASGLGTDQITLTGSASLSDYQTALDLLHFNNPGDNFDVTDRVIEFVVNDGDADSNIATTTIEMIAVNDPPELGVDDAVNTNLNAAFIENGGEIPIADVSAIADLDDTNIESATITLTNPFAGDALSLAGSLPSGIVASGLGTDQITLTGSASLSDYQTALDLLRFNNPGDNFDVTDRVIEFVVNDGDADSNIATTTIEMIAVNDPPELGLDDVVGTDINQDFVENSGPLAIADVAAVGDPDDVNIESATITLTNPFSGDFLTLLGSLPGGIVATGDGTDQISLVGSASLADYEAAIDLIAFNNPGDNFDATDRVIEVVINDGELSSDIRTSTINMIPVNDPPQGVNDNYETQEDTSITISASGVLSNDSDAEGDTISALLVANPSHGTVVLESDGSFTYTPDADFNGIDTFRYQPTDGEDPGNVTTVTINVTPVNDAPVAVDDTYTIAEDNSLPEGSSSVSVALNDFDVDLDPLTVTLLTDVAHGTLNLQSNGEFTYDPDPDYTGVDTFTYRITDPSGASDDATVTINITPVNDAPVAVDDTFTTNEDTLLTSPAGGVLLNDTDPDLPYGDSLTVSLDSTTSHGVLNLQSDGSFTYQPDADYNGDDFFTYTITDSFGENDTAVARIIVNPVNDPPEAFDKTITVEEESTGNNIAIQTPVDTENDPLTIEVTKLPDLGTVTLSNGTPVSIGDVLTLPELSLLKYNAPNDYLDGDSVGTFEYSVDDGTDQTTGVVNFNILAINDPPEAFTDTITVLEESDDNPVTITPPTDIDGDPLTVEIIQLPSLGTFELNGLPLYIGQQITVAELNQLDYDAPEDYISGQNVGQLSYRVTDGDNASDVGYVNINITPVNDPPTAVDDAYTLNEDQTFTGNVGTNDIEPDNDPLIFTLKPGFDVSNGQLSLNTDGTFTYTPDLNYHGTDSFQYIITDPSGETSEATVTLTINPVNDPPIAEDDAFSLDEDTTLNATVTANDSDIDGDTLTYTLITDAAEGSLTLNQDGTFSYTPDANFFGTDFFTYSVSDGNGGTDTAIADLTINPVNDPPIAEDDAFQVNEDQTLTISSGSLLVNDSDIEFDPLTITILTNPTNGVLIDNMDGTYDYQPNQNYSGPDQFTYQLSDGNGGTDTATVTIDVLPVNDPPVAVNDEFSTNEDTNLNITQAQLLDNDSDPDGDLLTLTIAEGPQRGTLVQELDGSFTYTPDSNESGIDTFTYKIVDPSGAASYAQVTIDVLPVNDPPVPSPDNFAVNENHVLSVGGSGILSNDFDQEGDDLDAILVNDVSNGVLVLNQETGAFTYTPNAGFSGIDTFTYDVTDGTDTVGPTTVTITVLPLGGPPVAVDDNLTTDEDVPLLFQSSDILGNDSDPNMDPLSFQFIGGPAHGTLSDNGNGTFTYSPNGNFNGSDFLYYELSDGNGNIDYAQVNITVNPVNDAPTAVDDFFVVRGYHPGDDFGTNLHVDLSEYLGNDFDLDGDTISIVPGSFSSAEQHGTLVVNADGSFDYTPYYNSYGTEQITYTITDGTLTDTGTILIEVYKSDGYAGDRVVDDNYTVDEDTTLTVPAKGVLINDHIPVTDAETVELVLTTSHGSLVFNPDGSFVYTPDANFNGVDSFVYRVYDTVLDYSDVATVTINVTPVNDLPTAGDDQFTMSQGQTLDISAPILLINDNDLEGPLTIVGNGGAANGQVTITPEGGITYTPDSGFSGVETIQYTAQDSDGAQVTGTIEITVNPTNTPPETAPAAYSLDEDTTITVPIADLQALASDPENDPISLSDFTSPANGTLTVVGNDVIYTPDPDFSGQDVVFYTVSDGNGGVAQGTITFTVNPVNDAPEAADDQYAVVEDGSLTIPASGILYNDFDTENDTLEAILQSGPANGQLALNADGSFTYTPDAGFNGTDSFTYLAEDSGGLASSATVTIEVTPVNEAPVATDDSYTVAEDGAISGAQSVLGNDFDPEGTQLTLSLTHSTQNGTLNFDTNTGQFDYTPDPDFHGVDRFTYQIQDADGGVDTAVVEITVTSENDPPTASSNTITVDEESVGTNLGLTPPSDPDNDSLTITVDELPIAGVVTLDGIPVVVGQEMSAGQLTFLEYDAPDDYNLGDPVGQFAYTVSDNVAGNPLSDTGVVAININPINDLPETSPVTVEATEEQNGIPFTIPNPTDVDGDPLTITISELPTLGQVFLNGNVVNVGDTIALSDLDQFTYDAPEDYLSSQNPGQLIYDVFDGTATVQGTVSFSITPINDDPVAVDNNYSVNEDQTLNIGGQGILGNDSDPDGDSLQVETTPVLGPSNGTLTLQSNGRFVYEPDENFHGTDSFEYRIIDGNGGEDTATVTITVNSVNDVPIAQDDNYTIDEDQTLTVNAANGILANDSDVDLDTLTPTVIGEPANGILILNSDGSFEYTPDSNFSGSDFFSYEISDGNGATATAVVTITVNPINDDPVANDDSYSLLEDTSLSLSLPGVLGNDLDADGDTLTITALSPNNGHLILNANGSFDYTPAADFFGTETFTYTVSDGNGGEDTGTISFNVTNIDDAPRPQNDQYEVNEDTTLDSTTTAQGSVLDNDLEVDGETLTAALVGSGTSNGNLTFNADGTFTYTPDPDFNGTDSFTYSVTDENNNTVQATATITVNPVNDAPVASGESYITAEDTPLIVNAAVGLLANDIDIDSATLSVQILNGPIAGLEAQSDGSFIYTPPTDFNGIVTINYQVSDGFLTSSPATATIEVTPVNDLPDTLPDSYSTNEDITLTVSAANGVLLNDIDTEDGAALTANLIQDGTLGTVALNDDGSFTYTPFDNVFGTDTFTYEAIDTEGGSTQETVTVTINPINDAPNLEDQSFTLYENDSIDINLSNLATDIDSNDLVFSVSIGPGEGMAEINGDILTYTPDPDTNGSDSLEITVTDMNGDGLSDSAQFSLTIDPVLVGMPGVDTFTFTGADVGKDFLIQNFEEGSGGDILDFSALLQGEENGLLEDFLSFNYDGNNTIIDISSNGDSNVDTTVTLEGVDLTDPGLNDTQILDNLIDDSQIVVDAM